MSIIHIVLLILALASFVIAYFSARTWHWGYVLVVLGIFLSTVGFFILSAEVLRINAVLRKQVNTTQQQLDNTTAENVALEKGSRDSQVINQLRNAEVRIAEDAESIPSLADLDHELLLETRDRGRVWFNVTPSGFDQATGVVKIAAPAGIKADSVVVVFEEGEPQLPGPDDAPRGKQYLGEFRVTAADAQTATLAPVLPLDDFEKRRIAASRPPWIMYDTMPADRYKIFAGMSEDDLKMKLPSQSVTEYIRHDKPAGQDDEDFRRAGFDDTGKRVPPDQVRSAAKQTYQRRLRDYAVEFDELARRRLVLLVDIDGTKQDIARLTAALESAKKLQAFREDESRKLATDLSGVTKERQAIEQHLAQLQQRIARGRKLLDDTLRSNSEKAKQLAVGAARSPAATIRASASGPLAVDSAR